MLAPRPPAGHILAYAQALDRGGVERVMLRLLRRWSESGRRVTLIVGDARGVDFGELPTGVEMCVLGRASMLGMGGLANLTRQAGPDILFCPGNHYSALAAWTRLRLGRTCPPIVAKISNALVRHDQSPMLAAGYRAWLRWHPTFVDRLVAMSPAMAAEARRTIGGDPRLLRVIPNPPVERGCDPEPVALPAGRFLVGVGRLVAQKRWDRLIAAFARLNDRAASLLILGEGAARAALEAQVAALGLGGRVLLPGQVGDPSAAIARASALVLVSDFEGVPGVLREALALGTPVVTTDSSVAVREIVTAPSQGTIVPVGADDALVDALGDWLVPGHARPQAVPEPGTDAALAYLDLFDEVVLEHRAARHAGLASGRSVVVPVSRSPRPRLPNCARARP